MCWCWHKIPSLSLLKKKKEMYTANKNTKHKLQFKKIIRIQCFVYLNCLSFSPCYETFCHHQSPRFPGWYCSLYNWCILCIIITTSTVTTTTTIITTRTIDGFCVLYTSWRCIWKCPQHSCVTIIIFIKKLLLKHNIIQIKYSCLSIFNE